MDNKQESIQLVRPPDHDLVIELKVMVQTVLTEMNSIKQQIRDMATQQATSFAAWDVKNDGIHKDQDGRIRKLEDLAIKYTPLVDIHDEKIKENIKNINLLQTNKNEFMAGWKAIIFVIGSIAGFVSFIWIIIQIFTAICVGHCIK